MIKKITKTITTTSTVVTTVEYIDTNTLNFKDTIQYRPWIDAVDIFPPLKDPSYLGKYESSGYDENLKVGWTRNDLGEIQHIFLTEFCNISNETFRKLEQKFPGYIYWKELKEYQSYVISFKKSVSYDKSIDTLTIMFRDSNMTEYLFNNSFEVLEYYSHLEYKTILALVIPGFKSRNKAFIKKLSTIYPQYLYWDLIEVMLRN